MQWAEVAGPVLGFAAGAGAAWLLSIIRRRRTPATPSSTSAAERRAGLASRLDAFKHVIESADIGVFFWDLARDSVRWSQRHYVIFDWPAGTPVTHAMFRQRVHPDDLAEVDATIKTALRDRADYAMRFRLRLDDGSIRYVRGSGRVDTDGNGRAAGVNGAVIDVTETTIAQNATRQRERELAAIAMHLPDIICRFDRDCRCVFMSSRIMELTGQAPESYIGKSCGDFKLPADVAARWSAVLESVMRDGAPREFDFTLVDQHGSGHFFITRALPSFDPEGRVESVLTVASDHTERERDARQVREDGAALRQADRRKNEYLATLAHELRGPLAPISSAAHLIRFSTDRQVRDKAREIIERQVAQLAGLVNDLMEVGRISAGKLDIERKPVTIQTVIDHALESARPLFEQKQQPVAYRLPPTPLWVSGDLLRLTQIFNNLLANASKYSPPGAPVAIDAGVDGDKVVVHVRDQGIGLPASVVDDIFELFVQVHATGIHAQGGLGIGLSLVKQLVELHGGCVTVSSEGAGRGSCFTVVLPLAAQPAALPLAVPEAPAVVQAPLTVLVVDDNVDGASTLALLLEALGHTAVLAFNGVDAVARAADHRIDMAFLDLGLPDISGVQVALRIRATPRGRELPLIALTGLGREEDRHLTSAAQFDEHITKPLQLDDLVRVTQAVARRCAGRSPV
ncbi:hybrid sensor histidine kinase/response regulator [Massilia phyllosphaerae]|uniref:hybrid sensor histidine kinase/response regulator n=1 Tax=Massilia phyllosphaerae TaxID=3106034 RepID=UPI002B1CB5E2|nr:ATP-binding protein [Massilia sp. SGZ-792]